MNEIIVKDDIRIEDLIYEVRGKQVMLDSDLARLYGCKNGTKSINLAVNRNVDRFPEDFYFQLTNTEYNNLKFQFETSSSNNNYGGVRKLPYVFTEQGVAMLSSVLKTEVASKMSVAIMRAFVAMRYYIAKNEYRLSNDETKLIEHDLEIKLLQVSFDKLEEKKKVNEIYFNGQIYDVYSKIKDIFNTSKEKLVIIDSYADNKVLDIVRNINCEVILITKKDNLLSDEDISRYNKQYHNLKVVYDNTFHDRYFIIDDNILYHCGTSINRIGYKTFSITLVGDSDVSKLLIDKVNKIIIKKFKKC